MPVQTINAYVQWRLARNKAKVELLKLDALFDEDNRHAGHTRPQEAQRDG